MSCGIRRRVSELINADVSREPHPIPRRITKRGRLAASRPCLSLNGPTDIDLHVSRAFDYYTRTPQDDRSACKYEDRDTHLLPQSGR